MAYEKKKMKNLLLLRCIFLTQALHVSPGKIQNTMLLR